MKLQNLFEDTTLRFASQPMSNLPLATFKIRDSVRKAVQTNLVVKANYTQTYHIISDIPPLSVKQYLKLIDVSFGEDSDDDPANAVRWNISTFPHLATREHDGQKTNELMNDKEWDAWEEKREMRTLGNASAKHTKVKTMTWKQFAADALKRFPFKAKHDFSE